MNICFVSQEYPPETKVGGIGTYTQNVASHLTNLGNTVHWITSSTVAKQSMYYDGIAVHFVKKINIRPLELAQLYH